MSEERHRAFLKRRGCSATVVAGGLAGLLKSWTALAGQLEPYQFGLYDFLNDMDGRHLIFELGPGALPALQEADRQVRKRMRSAGRCLWGEENAARLGYREDLHWWYYSVPIQCGEELLADLADR